MRSLTTRVAIAGALVAILLVAFVGTTSFLALRTQLRESLQSAATHSAELHGSQIATVVAGLVSHLTSTAANPLIANALTDTVGREAYVAPFLRGILAVNGVPVSVTMTDFKGRVLASNTDVLPAGDFPTARRAITEGRTIASVEKVDGVDMAMVAVPIIYVNSGTAEGALAYRFAVKDLNSISIDPLTSVTISLADDAPEWSRDTWGEARHVQALPGGLFLLVKVRTDHSVLEAPQNRLMVVFVVVGGLCLVMVAAGSQVIARAVTRRLVRLEEDAAKVVETASFSKRFSVAGGDEVSRLAQSFNRVLDRLEAAHRELSDHAAAQLRDSETRYRLLAEHASDLISRVSDDGTICYVSPAITRLLGFAPADVVGAKLSTLIHTADRQRVGVRFANSGDGSAIAFRMLDKGGQPVWVEASAHSVEADGKGDVVAIIRDIGRRKAAEDALAAKTVDLERSNAELEQFAYVASHDLREPLRMVSNYLQLIDRRLVDKDEDMTEFMGFAIDGARRMDHLILDMLEFSRVGRNRPAFELVDLAKAVAEGVRPFEAKLADTGGRIEIAESLPVVMGDRQELGRLFQNLVGNALKYVPPDRAPVVRVDAVTSGGEVVVSVADNGIGIAPEHRERIFLIFQRLHGRGKYEGTGVGLAICKKIVDLHGGRIWVEDNDGEGSIFRVALPLPG